ncbi:putative hydrolase [Stieleria neptunia]|uniref:Putative hydrolase n=1 Tax=Stieleria neptunia TaxID=2527979 RepID=A0A518I2B7_9BACT|nr:dienelactone hydrolase family protein [Stieleria neptunia]QDV47228.1 putative hydrolase [Stieleria neptunia]
MNQPRKTRYGSLDSYVVDAGRAQTPSALAILCHGFGAPGSDLVGIAGEWIEALGKTAESFRFIFPIAPHSLDELGMPSGRAWWMLNMTRMMDAIQAQQFEELHHETPPGLEESRRALSELVNAARDELADQRGCDADAIPFALGGFSQGAMLAMDTALRGPIPAPDLLIQFSGSVICQDEWTESLSRLQQTPVYQSHGTQDPILPFQSAERLRDLLAAAGVDLQFHPFFGPHTIDGQAIASTAIALQQLVDPPPHGNPTP